MHDFIYIDIYANENIKIYFNCIFSTEKENARAVSELSSKRKLRPIEQLKHTLSLLRIDPDFKREYMLTADKVKQKKAKRNQLSENVYDHIHQNISTASRFNTTKFEKLSNFARSEESRIYEAKEKRKDKLKYDIAKRLVTINRLELKKTSNSFYSQLKNRHIKLKTITNKLQMIIFLVRYSDKIHKSYKAEALRAFNELKLRVSIYKIMSVIVVRLKIVSIHKSMRTIRPFIHMSRFWRTTQMCAVKPTAIKRVYKVMDMKMRVCSLHKCSKEFFIRLGKIKYLFKRFIILHNARKGMLEKYWQEFLEEYRQAAKRFKLQTFAPKLEENLKQFESMPR
jgi:hypothetical protein